MGEVRIVRGISADRMTAVTDILIEALAPKIELVVRPSTPEQMRGLVASGIDGSLGWIALDDDDTVVGVVGVGVPGRRFSHVGSRALVQEFGVLGAISRCITAIGEEVMTRPGRRRWRIDAARAASIRTVGLEVVDTNEGAYRLYESVGFRSVLTVRTGWITAGAGFRAIRFMRLEL